MKKVLPFIFPLFVFCLGLFLIHKSWWIDQNNEHLKKVAVETVGVVEFAAGQGSASRIGYRVDGKDYSIHASIGRGIEGTKVSIFYDPENPSNALTTLDYYDNTNIIGLLLGGALAASLGLVGMYRTLFVGNKKERLEEKPKTAAS